MKQIDNTRQIQTDTSSRRLLAVSVAASLSVHAFGSVLFERFGSYDFRRPVTSPAVVMVELDKSDTKLLPDKPEQAEVNSPVHAQETSTEPVHEQKKSPLSAVIENLHSAKELQEPVPQQLTVPRVHDHLSAKPLQLQPVNPHTPSEVRYVDGNDLVSAQQEKLVYQLSLGAMPVGSAHLEASNRHGEIRIQSTIRSNSVVSAFYQVNDSTDTRLIKGRYLLTRIRQYEGTTVSDTGFNLMYPERKIFWVDRIRQRFSNEPLESNDTLDFISGLYFLRQQPLVVGDKRTLPLYDGDTTTMVPVSVLRTEVIALPGMRSVETLVVQPQFAASGFFRNNRDLLVWFTNDDNRVPVRMEASTPIGRITAEIVLAERNVTSN